MSELCFSGSTKSTHFSNLILNDLKLFFSFIHSHPLYFCYIIFLSPYFLKIFSFLSPLFITTSLLLLGFLTLYPQSEGDFVLSAYGVLKEKLSFKNDPRDQDDFCGIEELEMYKIVFDTSVFYQVENSDEDSVVRIEEGECEGSRCEIPGMGLFEAFDPILDEKTVEVDWEESAKPVMEEKILEEFLEPYEDFENMPCYVDEKKVEPCAVDTDEFDVKKELFSKSIESEEIVSKSGGDIVSAFSGSPSSRSTYSSFGSYGSMRREKEWTRTLACKLFEERHRGDGEEGMDLLWETYEIDSSNKGKKMKGNTKKDTSKKKIHSDTCYEDNDDEEEAATVQLCCLQALKFSTGKMNLGMGKPNIVKISRAIKGFGWLHNVTRRSKRGYTSK